MSFLSTLGKAVSLIIDDVRTPETFKIGEKFEDYVRKELFTAKYYTLVYRTPSYRSNSKDYAESSLKPDFIFRDKHTNEEFYVEAKFRTSDYQGKFVWCNSAQLNRYKDCHREKPVFVILGIGENPNRPDVLSLISLNDARYTGLYHSVVEKFRIDVDKAVSSRTLWSI